MYIKLQAQSTQLLHQQELFLLKPNTLIVLTNDRKKSLK